MASGGITVPITVDAGSGVVSLEQLSAKLLELEKTVDDVNKKTKQSESGFGSLAKSLGGLAAAYFSVRGAVGFVTDAIALQSQQVDAVNKLNLALANQGQLTAETSRDLQDYAASLQSTSLFGDEAIISLEGQLAAFGLVGDELKRATAATLDFAQATGRGLKEAGTAVGKAFAGQFEVLREIGVTIDQTKGRTEQFQDALGALESRFGGAAQAATQSFVGSLKQLGNTFGDFKESVGGVIAESGGLVQIVSAIGNALSGLTSFVNDNQVALANMVDNGLVLALDVLLELLNVLDPVLQLVGLIADGWSLLADVAKELTGGLVDFKTAFANISLAGDAFRLVMASSKVLLAEFGIVLNQVASIIPGLGDATKANIAALEGYKASQLDAAQAAIEGRDAIASTGGPLDSVRGKIADLRNSIAASIDNQRTLTAEFKNQAGGAREDAKALAELAKHQEAVAKAFGAITGQVDPKAFGLVAEALGQLDSASQVAEGQLQKLAEQIVQAKTQGLTLPPVADAIVERWRQISEAETALKAFNEQLKEQAEIARLLGPTAEDNVDAFVRLEAAAEAAAGGVFDLAKLGDQQLLEFFNQLNEIDDAAKDLGQTVPGLSEDFVAALSELNRRGLELPDTMFATGEATKAAAEEGSTAFEQLGETMQSIDALFRVLGISADSFGGKLLSTLTSLPQAFGSITEGLGSLFKGIGGKAGGGLLEGISGVLGKIGVAGQIATAAVGIGSAIVGLFKSDPVKKAQKEAGQALGVGISRDLAEEIVNNADRLGIAVKDAALLALPDAIAESGKAASTFTGEILSLFDAVASGAVPAAEGIKALGESFQSVADEALAAGRVGDQALRSIISRSRELGQSIPEIDAFVGQQLDNATAGLGKFVDSLKFVSDEAFATLGEDAATIFGATFNALVSERGIVGAVDALGGSFDALRDRLEESLGPEVAAQLTAPFAAAFTLLADENLRPLVEGIDGLGQAFTGLANADFLNIDQFRAAERATATLFDELIAGGADTNTALLAIAPTIQAAISAAESFGVPLDEDTQRLKDLAEQNGITFKTDPQQAMLDVLVEIAKVLGADIPEAARRATEGVQGLAGATPTVPTIPTGGATAGGAPQFPGGPGPGAVAPGARPEQPAQNIEFNVDLRIDENPLAAAETAEALRKDTINQVANAFEDRVASLVASIQG